jgi:hypothetical protein
MIAVMLLININKIDFPDILFLNFPFLSKYFVKPVTVESTIRATRMNHQNPGEWIFTAGKAM